MQAIDLQSQADGWEANRLSKLAQLEQSRVDLEQSITQLGDSIQSTDALQKELAGFAEERQKVLTPVDDSEKRKIQDLLTDARGELNKVQYAVTIYNKQIGDYNRLGVGECSKCGQQITEEYLNQEIGVLTDHLAKEGVTLDTKQINVQKLEGALADWEDYIRKQQADQQTKIQYIATREQAIRSEIQAMSYRQQEHQRKQRELHNISNLVQTTQAEVNPYTQQIQANQDKIKGIQVEIQRLEEEAKGVATQVSQMDFWVGAFGPKGLKSYILDSKLQTLNEAVNSWVKILTGGTISIKFEAQKVTRSKKVVNAPEIRVFRSNPDGTTTERNYKSWSGGEKQRISLAIDFGLSRLIARRSGETYNLLILDELFRHLDQKGKESVVDLIQQLASEKDSVFVVEHDEGFTNSFDNKIVVQKQNRRSTILEDH
jgi:DNA repair exonuclease SbcCD ATPase subunit